MPVPSFSLPPTTNPKSAIVSRRRLRASTEPLLAPDARVVAKHFWRDAPPARIGLLASERERRFGETVLTFYRRVEPDPAGGDSTEGA